MKHEAIISPHIRLRHRDRFTIGEGSIVDDYCYFSTRITIGRFSHIASQCTVGGGASRHFILGDFSSLSSGVRVWCSSDDFVRDIVTIVPEDVGPVKEHFISGDVILERLTAVGSNSVIMPRNHLPEGVAIGALSYVPPDFAFEPWTVYAGIPIRAINSRDRELVLRQLDAFEARLAREAGRQ